MIRDPSDGFGVDIERGRLFWVEGGLLIVDSKRFCNPTDKVHNN